MPQSYYRTTGCMPISLSLAFEPGGEFTTKSVMYDLSNARPAVTFSSKSYPLARLLYSLVT